MAGKFGAICTEFPLATFSAKKLKRICSQIFRQKYGNTSSCKNNWGKLLIFLCNMKMMGWTFDFPRNKFWLRITLPYLFHFFARGNVSNTTYKEAAWRDKPFPIKIWRPNLRYPFLHLVSNLPPLTCLSLRLFMLLLREKLRFTSASFCL